MKTKILKDLETTWAGRNCICYDTLESTNDQAKELAKEKPIHGTLVVAEQQTKGKGRRGRRWNSEKGKSISMSLCLEPKLSTDKVSGVTLIAALAVAEAISEIEGANPLIKWPNDIVMNQKKICGILTEMHFMKDRYVVIVGIGVNVNQQEFPEDLRNIASSLKCECGKEVSGEWLIGRILKHFELFYEQFEKTGDLSLLKAQYECVLANKGKEVRVLDPAAPFMGIAKGITNEGNLVVVCEDGRTEEVCSGEVSVRGLYGYV